MAKVDAARALELLRRGSAQPGATFRDGQEEAIGHVVAGHGRLLVVQKTGWGKSFVYFIATKLLREAGGGPALLVSPLLSLMRNQIGAAERMGVRAATINSTNPTEWAAVAQEVARGNVDILLISPERLGNEEFQRTVLGPIAPMISLLVIDEAHCISDWGHDFRPHYRLIERTAKSLPPNVRLLATTATANDRVMADLHSILGDNLVVSRGDLARPSLTLQAIRIPDQAGRLAWLADTIPGIEGSGIVYTLTVRDADLVARWLWSKGIDAAAYHGGLDDDKRVDREERLLRNELKVLVATTALGMGYDKPDLAFVIHYQMPGSVVHYYQQVGRAGRAIDSAYGVLLSGSEETDILDYFIESAFPSRDEVTKILDVIERSETGLSIPKIMAEVNLTKSRIEKAIALLALESPAPIVKDGTRWQLTAAPLAESFWDRAERLTALRREEQAEMRDYIACPFGEQMPFLIRALDGDAAGIPSPLLPPLAEAASEATVQEAIDFLKRTNLPFEARKRWPDGGLPRYRRAGLATGEVNGNIEANRRARDGRALCTLGDAGWGEKVRVGKHRDGRFGDDLVSACVRLVKEWNPQPAPQWVTSVPSLRHPQLVPDFAARLAKALGLPFIPALEKTEPRPEQKAMSNSTFQARNVDGSLGIVPGNVPSGPVLLVDDIVGSRWTLTVAAWLLRRHGSGEVWPLALSMAGSEA